MYDGCRGCAIWYVGTDGGGGYCGSGCGVAVATLDRIAFRTLSSPADMRGEAGSGDYFNGGPCYAVG
jgi:hypothetical protein